MNDAQFQNKLVGIRLSHPPFGKAWTWRIFVYRLELLSIIGGCKLDEVVDSFWYDS